MFFQLTCFDIKTFFLLEMFKLIERLFESTQMTILTKETISPDKFHPFKEGGGEHCQEEGMKKLSIMNPHSPALFRERR